MYKILNRNSVMSNLLHFPFSSQAICILKCRPPYSCIINDISEEITASRLIMMDTSTSETSVSFTRLRSAIPPKTALFILVAVGTWNLSNRKRVSDGKGKLSGEWTGSRSEERSDIYPERTKGLRSRALWNSYLLSFSNQQPRGSYVRLYVHGTYQNS